MPRLQAHVREERHVKTTRQQFNLGLAGTLAAAAALPGRALAAAKPPLPKSAVTLNVMDVGGSLALCQRAIDKYAAEFPQYVSHVTYSKAPAPELAGKVKAEQAAGALDIDLVLSGTDALAAGIEQGTWLKLTPDYAAALGGQANYVPAAALMNTLAQGYGVLFTYTPSGPLVEYVPARVPNPPASTSDLLAWAKAHPGRYLYARPANSGPGRTWLMGLPYLLKDKDPHDPVNGWSKTWAYLKQLHQYIEYYPTGTGITMQALGDGSLDMIASTMGWDLNPRILGTVPKEAKVASLAGFTWVMDGQFMIVPKGIANDKLAVVLDLIDYCLRPVQQAFTYDNGFFYPGPAIKGVTLALAPKDSQDAVREYLRPEYEKLIAAHPQVPPLEAKGMVSAFDIWDREIGADKIRK
jgi:putative spermidine/putrescine transport system substrate-binding protein